MAFLGLDASNFHAGLRHASSASKEVGGEIKSHLGEFAHSTLMNFAAAGGVLSLGEIVQKSIEAAEHIRQLSVEFRVSTDTIQIWEKGARMAGLSAEDIGNSMNKLKKAREAAIAKGDVGGFGAFGIGMDELKNTALSTEQIMDRMREAANSHPITDAEDVAGMELMGRSGAKILSAMQQIQEIGPIKLIDAESIETLHKAHEELEESKRKITIGGSWIAKLFNFTTKEKTAEWNAFKKFIGHRIPAEEIGKEFGKEMGLVKDDEKKLKEPEKPNSYHKVVTVDLFRDEVAAQTKLERLAKLVFEHHLQTLTPLQREVELKKEIAEHEKKAIEYRFQGMESARASELIEAEELRGKLLSAEKKKPSDIYRMDYTASERIGSVNYAARGMFSAGMDHAASTAQHTHDTFVAVKELLQYVKGYTLNPNNDRRKHTHDAVHFG
jgi:hypothetical protein